MTWPLRRVYDAPANARFDLPPGVHVRDVDIAPDGPDALIVVEREDKSTEVMRWDFASAPAPQPGLQKGATTMELARSPFDDTVYLVETRRFD